MFFDIVLMHISEKVRTFAAQKKKKGQAWPTLIKLIKDNTKIKERKETMSTVTSIIAFAIVAIAAIVSNASVFNDFNESLN